MERINNNRRTGLNGSALRTWGFLFIVLGAAGMGIVQYRLLGLGNMTTHSLLEAMEQSGDVMAFATVALVLQAMESCAVPIFAFLLVEGYLHTSDLKMYMVRVGVLALVSELPYNLAMGGSIWVTGSRNPVFALVIGLVMMYLYSRFKQVLIKILITVCAVVWCEMLDIDHGSFTVILVATLWGMRKRPQYRLFVGCAAAVVCSIISPFYLASPMSFLALHSYNGEPGDRNRLVNYLCYPVILLIIGIVAKFI